MRRDEIELVWAAGRDAVAALIEAQAARIDELVASNAMLVARVEELERQAGRSSRNSSLPPSRDSPDARKQRPKKQSGRRQGGQSGHPGMHREMVADPDRVVEHWPSACASCGEQIRDRVADGAPVAHQVSEIIVRVEVTEHRRMRARCRCGCRTLAELPAGVPAGAFGPAVAAAAATLTAARVSRREAARLLADLCGLQVSAASVEALVKQASDALEDTYVEVLGALDRSAVRGADETSWQRAGQTQRLSVATAEQAPLFQIADRRDRDAAKALLGDSPGDVIVSIATRSTYSSTTASASCASRTSSGTSSRWASAAAPRGAWAASSPASSAKSSRCCTNQAATATTWPRWRPTPSRRATASASCWPRAPAAATPRPAASAPD